MHNIFKILTLLIVSLVSCAQLPANFVDRQFLFSVTAPIAVRHAGDGSNRLFIVEQNGTIKIYDGTNLLPGNFLDISAKVFNGGERGLLGLDFDPDYANNGYFYVNYTKSGVNSGDTIIERYSVSSGDANIADPNSGVVIMRVDQPFSNHNGGDIHFGPDGYLYIGMGDGGDANDPGNRSQNLGSLLGKMLRIDVSPINDLVYENSFEDPSTPRISVIAGVNTCGLDSITGSYRVPNDNPFLNDAGACAEIWAFGLRNPYRWSFDKQTDNIIMGDVGQDDYDEVDFQPATSSGGENYGWRCREGSNVNPNPGTSCAGGETFTEPVIDISIANPSNDCSVMGGYVYRGTDIPSLQGLYIFSDFCGGSISFATPSAGTWSFQKWQDSNNNIGFGTRGFGEDEQGEIYHIYNNSIYKFIPNN